MLLEKIEALAAKSSNPTVTISLNTYRTHPQNEKDEIRLKNLCQEAEDRLLSEFEKRNISKLLENLEKAQASIDSNYNLDSLHLFISNDVSEVVKLPWPIRENSVQITEHFNLRPLINGYNRTKEYFIVLLSKDEVKVFNALDDSILNEVRNEDFPFNNTKFFNHDVRAKMGDSGRGDDLIRELFNRVDKALVNLFNEEEHQMVVVSTSDNYQKLISQADRPNIYLGHVDVNYNDVSEHKLAKDAWEFVKDSMQKDRKTAIEELKAAVSKGKVLTDLQEIYQASKFGRGDLLIVNGKYTQPVMMKGEHSLELIKDATQKGANDDIVSDIAWEVLSKKGRVVFTEQPEFDEIGKIALKVRW